MHGIYTMFPREEALQCLAPCIFTTLNNACHKTGFQGYLVIDELDKIFENI